MPHFQGLTTDFGGKVSDGLERKRSKRRLASRNTDNGNDVQFLELKKYWLETL